ncbi:hypothetical protein ACA910_002257 [Epithemia clementina (nom. ined.)]
MIAAMKGLDPADVLLGRGKRSHEHWGNKAYMDIIFSYLPAYTATTRNNDKSHITIEVVALVKKNGGRFSGINQSHHSCMTYRTPKRGSRCHKPSDTNNWFLIGRSEERRSVNFQRV